MEGYTEMRQKDQEARATATPKASKLRDANAERSLVTRAKAKQLIQKNRNEIRAVVVDEAPTASAGLEHRFCMDYAQTMHELLMDYAWIEHASCMHYMWIMSGLFM